MTLFRSSKTAIETAVPVSPPPRQRRTEYQADAAATPTSASSPSPVSFDLSATAVGPTVSELIWHVVDGLTAERASVSSSERARLAAQLHERIVARVAYCRDAVIASRLACLQHDQLVRLRHLAPSPEHLVDHMSSALDQTTLLAFLKSPMQEPAIAAPDLDSLDPGSREAALDTLSAPAALDRFDRSYRRHCARALIDTLQTLALTDADRHAALRSLTLEDADHLPASPPHRGTGEALLLEALRAGDQARAIQVLAAAALVPITSVETAIMLRSRRGMVSLAWKAGYSMRAAILIQSQLAGIAPNLVLVATADGGCPLSRDEIVWQLGFLAQGLG